MGTYKRVYANKVKIFLKGIPIALTFGILIYLVALGNINITYYSEDMICTGTLEEPCYAYINFTMNKDYIYIYPNESWSFYTDTNLKLLEFQVRDKRYKEGYRTIDLSKPSPYCQRTGCKYAFRFYKTKGTWEIRYKALKNNPYGDIKWGFGSIDPVWEGIITNSIYKSSVKNHSYRAFNDVYSTYFKNSTKELNELVTFEFKDFWVKSLPQSLFYYNESDVEMISSLNNVFAELDKDNKNKVDILYKHAFGSNKHLEYAFENNTFVKKVVINKLSDLPEPTLEGDSYLVFKEEVKFSDKLYMFIGENIMNDKEFTTQKEIEFFSNPYKILGVENKQFVFPVPYAIDKNGSKTHLTYKGTYEDDEFKLNILVPYSWLQNAVYPVIIDPSITVFNNSLSVENLTFISGETNKTRYLAINKDVNILSGYLNLTGYISSTLYWSDWYDDEDAFSSTGTWNDIANTHDENWGTYGDPSGNADIEERTNLDGLKAAAFNTTEFVIKGVCPDYGHSGTARADYYAWNFNTVGWDLIGTDDDGSSTEKSFSANKDHINDTDQEVRLKTDAIVGSEIVRIYESKTRVNFNYSYITGPYLDIGNDNIQEWNVTELNNTNSPNKTIDLSSAINTALNDSNCNCEGCILNGDECLIPFVFVSDSTGGNIRYSAINISYRSVGALVQCQDLDRSMNYTLENDVVSNGTCFNISNENINLDCQGHSITGNITHGSGIQWKDALNHYVNISIKNCVIKNFRKGIYFTEDFNTSLIQNNTIINSSGGGYGYGIEVYNGYNSQIIGNNINTSIYGIVIQSSSGMNITNNTLKENTMAIYFSDNNNTITTNNTIRDNDYGIECSECHDELFVDQILINNTNFNIDFTNSINNEMRRVTSKGSSYGLSLDGTNNTLIKDCGITNNSYLDISLISNSRNNTFLNVSFNTSNTSSNGGELIRKWYFDLTVQDSSSIVFPNVNATIYNISGIQIYSALTNNSGQITQQEITEYIDLNGTISYHTNHTINVTYSSCTTNSSKQNITTNLNIDLKMNCIFVNPTNLLCGGLTCEDYWYDYIDNINCSGAFYINKPINYLIEAYYDSAWTYACNHTNGSTCNWSLSGISKQSDVDLRCSANYSTINSSLYTADVNITIWAEWINISHDYSCGTSNYILGLENTTQYNIIPFGQNSSCGIFNITNNADSTANASIYISINETKPDWRIWISNSSSRSNAILINTTRYLIYHSLGISSSHMFWNWVDVINLTNTTWKFKFIFESEYI